MSGTVPAVAQLYSMTSPTGTGADIEALKEALAGTSMQWVISHSGQFMTSFEKDNESKSMNHKITVSLQDRHQQSRIEL